MGKNLLTKIGLTIILTASTVLYQGCLNSTSYEQKCNCLSSQLDQRERIGDYRSPMIVPLFELKTD